jgi:ankyrin repeat protein
MKRLLIALLIGMVVLPLYSGEKDLKLIEAIRAGNLKDASELLKDGAKVNFKSNFLGWTPLHFAVSHGRTEIIQLLLLHKADVNAMDTKLKWTPMHLAAYKGFATIVEILLLHKANVNMEDKDGRTPLDVAKTEEVKKILLKAGAKHGVPRKNEKTASSEKVKKAEKQKKYDVNTKKEYNSEFKSAEKELRGKEEIRNVYKKDEESIKDDFK